MAREDIAVRIVVSCILGKHRSGPWTNLNPRKFGRGPNEARCARRWRRKRTTQRWEVSALQGPQEHAASAGGLLKGPSGVAGESQG